ncbi:hypothetical protein MCOR21_002764 [Pyricularia oryzae]|nr:hypothetical protein MCOR01_010496 [Pyricularia oryzae]KAI6433563.1 hypothetical protein MCOR21_002764 [Pyricularia oryzae]
MNNPGQASEAIHPINTFYHDQKHVGALMKMSPSSSLEMQPLPDLSIIVRLLIWSRRNAWLLHWRPPNAAQDNQIHYSLHHPSACRLGLGRISHNPSSKRQPI